MSRAASGSCTFRSRPRRTSNGTEFCYESDNLPAAPEAFPGDDTAGWRFTWAFIISLVVNLLLWTAASGVALQPVRHDFKLMEVTRVVLKPPPPVVKPPPKKPVVKRPAPVHKPKP